MSVNHDHMMVRDYPLEERPRERMIKEGAQNKANHNDIEI